MHYLINDETINFWQFLSDEIHLTPGEFLAYKRRRNEDEIKLFLVLEIKYLFSLEISETDTADVLPPEDDTNTQSAQTPASSSKKVKVSKIDLFDKSSFTNDVLSILPPLPVVVVPSSTFYTSNPSPKDVVPFFSKSAPSKATSSKITFTFSKATFKKLTSTKAKSIAYEEASTIRSIFSTHSISLTCSISSARNASTCDTSTTYKAFTICDTSTICEERNSKVEKGESKGNKRNKKAQTEFYQQNNVKKVHEDLYMPSDLDNPSSEMYMDTQSVLEAIFDEKYISTKINAEVVDS
ncbi:6206_t:CDS:2 [Funneliformis caledonium]|uniref:6206_t:CDS:1 n=1 Tax=Funneliformis caledonium TaxID=1117310 RepID=A0A9N9DDU6_9GLOM|nr:6206_t:CDS:2 [Funneliformis caledonium]